MLACVYFLLNAVLLKKPYPSYAALADTLGGGRPCAATVSSWQTCDSKLLPVDAISVQTGPCQAVGITLCLQTALLFHTNRDPALRWGISTPSQWPKEGEHDAVLPDVFAVAITVLLC